MASLRFDYSLPALTLSAAKGPDQIHQFMPSITNQATGDATHHTTQLALGQAKLKRL